MFGGVLAQVMGTVSLCVSVCVCVCVCFGEGGQVVNARTGFSWLRSMLMVQGRFPQY